MGDGASDVRCIVRLQPFVAEMKPGSSRVTTHVILTPILSEVLADPKADWRFLIDGREYSGRDL